MFKELMKTLKGLEGRSVSIPIEADTKGYIDKQCPAEDCEFLFKINEEDGKNIFRDVAVWCPMCRHEAPADQWYTIAQVKHSRDEALTVVKGEINQAMRTDARNFNRRQPRKGFLSMSMDVKGGTNRTYILPVRAAETMQLEIQCDNCSARFAVIGSAYFCPACGFNSVIRTFNDSLRKIKAKKNGEDAVRASLIQAVGQDDAELTCRSLRETCLTDGVTAFQKYCEGLFEPYGTVPMNAFQRIDDGSDLWRNTVGVGYDEWLLPREIDALKILYQKRHLFAHQEGIVDDRYVQRSGDTTYKPGQRIVVSRGDIEALLELLEKLGRGLGDKCGRA
jgi:hypothetical protein